jgi:hypothetical protein
LLYHVREEENFEHTEEYNAFDYNQCPELFADSHRLETINIKLYYLSHGVRKKKFATANLIILT